MYAHYFYQQYWRFINNYITKPLKAKYNLKDVK